GPLARGRERLHPARTRDDPEPAGRGGVDSADPDMDRWLARRPGRLAPGADRSAARGLPRVDPLRSWHGVEPRVPGGAGQHVAIGLRGPLQECRGRDAARLPDPVEDAASRRAPGVDRTSAQGDRGLVGLRVGGGVQDRVQEVVGRVPGELSDPGASRSGGGTRKIPGGPTAGRAGTGPGGRKRTYPCASPRVTPGAPPADAGADGVDTRESPCVSELSTVRRPPPHPPRTVTRVSYSPINYSGPQ